MSRRRTGARYVPITISLEPKLIDTIESKLGPKQSRSAWIAKAILNQLQNDGGDLTVADASSGYLMSVLRRRPDLNGEQQGIIEYWLSNWRQPE